MVEGFGGGIKAEVAPEVSPEIFDAMQRSAAAAIVAKAGSRLPIVAGRDKGLPKAPPIFDLDEMRKRNNEIAAKFGRK